MPGDDVASKRIDLDAHVIAKPLSLTQEKWGALDTPHRKGLELYPSIDEALLFLNRLFEAEDRYYFQLTPGGNLAMQQLLFHFYLNEVRQTGKNHFLSSEIEDAPILKTLDRMEMLGCGVKLLPVDSCGRIDLKTLEQSLGPKTSLVSISAVCAMTGVIQPVQEIIQICRPKGVKVHVNATHAIGSWGVSLKEWDVDYLSWDGDKLGTPSGIGGLFSREQIRDGMTAPQALLHLVEALRQIAGRQEQFAMEMARLRYQFEDELLRAIPDAQIIAREAERAPHLFCVAFPGLMNEALLYLLYRQNIDASIGGGQFQTVTAILKKCGFADEVAISGLSLALSHHLQEDDLAEALDRIVTNVRKLKKMSVAL